jgi:thiamine transport system substrate-binding protein
MNNICSKKSVFFPVFCLAAGFILFSGCSEKKPDNRELVVWTYDSFNSEWGPGPAAGRLFLEQTGTGITWVSHENAGEMLARLLIEGDKADADIILGLDQNMLDKALQSGLFESYAPTGLDAVFPEILVDETNRLIPVDYSYFAFVYDSEVISNPPANLEALTGKEYGKKIIIMDPRTSSPGLGLLAWTKTVYGQAWPDYWRRLSPSVLTVAGSWSSGYGLFTAGEAPLVLSYTTSPGYHLAYEDTERYQAALFTDGHPLQIELAGILKAGKNQAAAKSFMDFILSPPFQNLIPETNWMYPVTDIPLPDSFRINPKSSKPLLPAPVTDADLDQWTAIMGDR